MKKKLLIGILILFGIAVSVFNPLIIGLLSAGVWIYLVRVAWKQKDSTLNDRKEPKISELNLKRLKELLIAGGFSFLVFIAAALVHNLLHNLSKTETTVSLIIALVALVVFVAATAGGMVIYLKERQKTE